MCNLHGGRAPQTLAKARERLAEAHALRLLDSSDLTPITDPFSALSALVSEVVALKDVLRVKVNDLEQITCFDRAGHEELRAVISAYERALDRAGRLLVDIGKLDLSERMVRVTEVQAEMLGVALSSVMAELDVPPSRWEPVAAVHLRALEAGKP